MNGYDDSRWEWTKRESDGPETAGDLDESSHKFDKERACNQPSNEYVADVGVDDAYGDGLSDLNANLTGAHIYEQKSQNF